ncbi:S9 family peptidase [Rhodohalobacter halophilus]|uniref:S9 family peptidase n=1 Tax=Rhodohalobacter halophilus TaxID=1812810 RepID=UPI00083F7BA2|nr:alpha/beta fold hydrolase [Rhodohalobacter halophilus]
MRKISYVLTLLLLISGFSIQPHAQVVPENLTLKEIFHEPVIPGIRPSFRSFNTTQDSIYFSWNDSSYFDTGLYRMALTDGDPEPIDNSEYTGFSISPNERLIAYTKDGNIYVANRDWSNERRIVASQEREISPVWSPNSRKLAFVRSGDVWVTDVTRPEMIQVTKRPSDAPGIFIEGWSGNNRLVLRQTDFSDARTIYFPEYVDEFVSPGASQRGIPSVSYYTADLETMKLDTLSSGVQRSSMAGSFTGNFSVKDSMDAALKERKIIAYNHRNGEKSVIFEDTTEGWLHGTSIRFAPRTDRLMIMSEQSGWNHIYIANLRTGNLEQITDGEYEVTWARWLGDQKLIYTTNEADYGERHIFIHDLNNNTVDQLTTDEAYRYQFRLSDDQTKLIYAKTYFNEPYDLYMIDLENPGEEIQLTNSVPERFSDYNWQKEEYVRFTGRDGETGLSMSLLYPANFDNSRTYPVVVFAHGAGSLQNVYKGWSNNYWREYMFHQYLLNQGYIVVEVDFRHSTGYGRKFREDVTDWMGKYEVEDIIDGLDKAQEMTGGALDLDNVGIYGGSYGGFMALYAVSDAPDRFHAAAALRKVSNWRNYYYANPWYTLPRLGDPDEVPEHYDRSSPLTYAPELERPVILLHGLIDDNVGAQDAFQYAEELIQSGNSDFEMMIYPSERHGFTSPYSWHDEYLRIFEFFEKHLK